MTISSQSLTRRNVAATKARTALWRFACRITNNRNFDNPTVRMKVSKLYYFRRWNNSEWKAYTLIIQIKSLLDSDQSTRIVTPRPSRNPLERTVKYTVDRPISQPKTTRSLYLLLWSRQDMKFLSAHMSKSSCASAAWQVADQLELTPALYANTYQSFAWAAQLTGKVVPIHAKQNCGYDACRHHGTCDVYWSSVSPSFRAGITHQFHTQHNSQMIYFILNLNHSILTTAAQKSRKKDLILCVLRRFPFHQLDKGK